MDRICVKSLKSSDSSDFTPTYLHGDLFLWHHVYLKFFVPTFEGRLRKAVKIAEEQFGYQAQISTISLLAHFGS